MNCVIGSPWIGITNGPMSIWEPNFKWITAPAHVDPTTLEIPGIFVPTNCQNPEHGWETTSFAMQCQILLRHRHEIFLAKPQKNNRQLVNPGIATPQGEIKQLKSNKHIPFKSTIKTSAHSHHSQFLVSPLRQRITFQHMLHNQWSTTNGSRRKMCKKCPCKVDVKPLSTPRLQTFRYWTCCSEVRQLQNLR